MAVPAYATDLTDIVTDMASTTGWTLISSGGGGANTMTAPETDDFIQGSNCISRNPWTSANIRGMVYNSSQTISSGNAIFIWTKSDVAQALDTKAAGGIQVLIGNTSGDLKCYYVDGKDTYEIGGWRCYVIDPTTTPSTTIGSPSSTTSYFGVRWAIPSSGPSKGFPYKIDAIRRGRSATVTAGDSGTPATWHALGAQSASVSNRWGIATPTNTGVQMQGIVNWGSSGAAVYSRDANRVVVMLGTNGFVSTSFTQIIFNHASTDIEWDNITIQALGTLNRGVLTINDNAKVWLTNCNFADINTIAGGGSNTKFDGSVFRRTNALTVASTPGSYLGIKMLTPTVAANTSALIWNSATDPSGKLDGSSFSKGTNAHHAIEFGLSSPTTISLTDIDFTGFSASNNANDSMLHIKRTSGTVTINLSGVTVNGGAGTVTYRTDGATVSLVASAQLELTGLKNPTEVRVYDAGTTTEIAGSENVTVGTFTTSIDSASYPSVDIAVISKQYQNLRLEAVSMSTDRSIPVAQQFDRQYYNP